jgi:hypothetical protein
VIENVHGPAPPAEAREEEDEAREGDPPPPVAAVVGVAVAEVGVEILGEVGELRPK